MYYQKWPQCIRKFRKRFKLLVDMFKYCIAKVGYPVKVILKNNLQNNIGSTMSSVAPVNCIRTIACVGVAGSVC